MNVKIYGLIDPRTNEVRYVGKSVNLNKRLYDHLKDDSNTYKSNWINQLKNVGLVPEVIILEECSQDNWPERERYHISQYNNLTNLTTGGEGCDFFAQEVRDKISSGVKTAWENPEYVKNIKIKRIEYWSDLNNRLNLSEKNKGRKLTEEQKNRRKETLLERWENPEYIEKMSKSSKSLWENDDYKNNVLSFLRSDENRKRISELHKGKPRSEETKDKISLGRKNCERINIDGIEYRSITTAAKLLNIKRGCIRTRLKSKNFPSYNYATGENFL